MKKSLLALAVLGAFAGAASAQSSVTLYGRVDLSVARNIGSDTTVLQNGSGSRLGVRGEEDLGGGLKATFNIEHRFAADTGAVGTNNNGADSATTNFWHGRSLVGLAGGFGSVSFGREYSPLFLYVALPADPWVFDTVAANGSLLGAITPSRKNNTLNYSSPDMSGFRAHAQLSLDEKVTNTADQEYGMGVALTYSAGPIFVGFGYDRGVAPAGSAEESPNYMLLSGSYNFGVAKLIAAYGRGTSRLDQKHRDMHIAATAPLGVGELRVSYNQLKNTTTDVKVSSKWGLGYHYPLSKRTTVYADVARDGEVANHKTGANIGLKHNF